MTPDPALDAFLRARRVAVLSIARDGGPPLSSPIWYDWDGRRFRMHVEATSAKARAIARHGVAPASVVVQSEAPPYRYVVAYGTATVSDGADPALRRTVARRYFGRMAGDMYHDRENAGGRALRTIEVVPERLVTHDFRPEAGRFGRFWFAVWRRLHPVPA